MEVLLCSDGAFALVWTSVAACQALLVLDGSFVLLQFLEGFSFQPLWKNIQALS